LTAHVPRFWRGLLYAAGWMAPAPLRAEWRERWDCRLHNFFILAERGEVPAHLSSHASTLCRDALGSAFRLRFAPTGWREWLRSPSFVGVGALAILAVTALCTHGFTATRTVIDAALDFVYYSVPRLPNLPHIVRPLPSHRANLVMAHLIPLLLAFATSIVLVLIRRLSFGAYGWRYWAFLAIKTLSAITIVPVLWIEIGAALRAAIPNAALSALIGGVALTLVFIASFGGAVVWVVTDQRFRCPICLRRLAMPVALGSWGSTFEPPATELLCDAGHGALCLFESLTGEPDRWVALDDSWRALTGSGNH